VDWGIHWAELRRRSWRAGLNVAICPAPGRRNRIRRRWLGRQRGCRRDPICTSSSRSWRSAPDSLHRSSVRRR